MFQCWQALSSDGIFMLLLLLVLESGLRSLHKHHTWLVVWLPVRCLQDGYQDTLVIEEMAEIERRLTEEKGTPEDFNNKSSFPAQSSGTFWTVEA